MDDALIGAWNWLAGLYAEGIDLTGNAHLKVVKEAAELAESPSIEEAADVIIAVLGVVQQLGFSPYELADAIEAKTAVNRLRTWVKQEDGTYQHA